ncbi:hypothetical protein [Sporomusa acidovorans]|uniref:hypothetical protein n=1 Tax=Sporomusa acidovorans TaxID=112900 RepID=UPI00146F7687|nr:hypothetical protein [Sporomusa acidovorans]
MLEFVLILTVIGIDGIININFFTGNIQVFPADEGGAGAVDVVAGVNIDVAVN